MQIPVIIPEYGEQYELDSTRAEEGVSRLGRIKEARVREQKYIRLEVLGRMQTLKEEIEDMSTIIQEEMLSEDVKDEKIVNLNEKIKELEQQIVKIIEE